MNEELDFDEELKNAEDELASSDDNDETPPGDIVAFNELRSCADLHRMYVAKQLEIQPDFQREVVWQPAEQTRFVDSLAKQLPIPSMCISLDYKTDKRQVVDGLQRMSSIFRFLSEPGWRMSKLPDVDDRISNKTVEYVKREHGDVFSRVENTTIPVTVLRCDMSKKSHQEYMFTIFHRLNKGGSKLTNQEIRNCIYSGTFNETLKAIVASDLFKTAFGIQEDKKYRFAYEELVLRIVSFFDSHTNYKGPLSKYLNDHMSDNRNISSDRSAQLINRFQEVLDVLYRRVLIEEPLPRISKATIEAILVGIERNFERIQNVSDETVRAAYVLLRGDPLFSVQALKEGLAATERVKARLDKAVQIFSVQ
ncbi:DUF262 domain-containing protein [Parvularcula sp. IMCC14364]|uniref:DUF262 domain-containing protein n=1 Tax=Parvularcula sp. IMCC14364 TaxID=3067902 RepID=UPI002741EC85|nr:DUF262 domain-containing protein [Parvularcula sp. IMCC14364]